MLGQGSGVAGGPPSSGGGTSARVYLPSRESEGGQNDTFASDQHRLLAENARFYTDESWERVSEQDQEESLICATAVEADISERRGEKRLNRVVG